MPLAEVQGRSKPQKAGFVKGEQIVPSFFKRSHQLPILGHWPRMHCLPQLVGGCKEGKFKQRIFLHDSLVGAHFADMSPIVLYASSLPRALTFTLGQSTPWSH